MLLLSLDTSAPVGAIALCQNGECIAEVAFRGRESHSAMLMPAVDQLLSSAHVTVGDIDAYGVVTGPGSFTGLRVGLATVKGLAWVGKKPVVGLPSLRVMAEPFRDRNVTVATMMDARRQRVYGAVYRWENESITELIPPSDLTASDLLAKTDGPVIAVGHGARAFEKEIQTVGDRITLASSQYDYCRGGMISRLAWQEFQAGRHLDVYNVEPYYLRKSEADLRLGAFSA